MIVLNAGVPRSGTVLVNAILRKLFEGAGLPCATSNPHGPELPGLVQHLQQSGQDRHRTVLVHTHSWDHDTGRLLTGSPHCVAFANYRDPRDVSVSLMRLHDHDLDAAIEMTLTAFQVFDACVQTTDAMVIPYELLVADKPGHIFQIARKLGLWPGMDRVAAIDEETSVDRHRAVMEKVRARDLDSVVVRKNRHRELAEDPNTLINDRHIQSGASGRWRGELDADQVRVANERFAPILKRYGYPLD